jgi:hypothetical protein
VATLQQQLSGIVAEEFYVQRVVADARPGDDSRARHRALRSDILLVRPAGTGRYVQFRDVFEVDGQPVRDREERLSRLFLDPSASAASQMRDILTESARFNVGRIERTINVPTLALMFLDPIYRPRLRFSRSSDRTPTTLRDGATDDQTTTPLFKAAAEVLVVEFRERDRPTIIKSPRGRNVPSRGRFWIEPGTGRIVMTELIAQDAAVRAIVDVTYAREPITGLLLPAAMRERYDGRDELRIDGHATYSNIRRFDVQVREDIRGPQR